MTPAHRTARLVAGNQTPPQVSEVPATPRPAEAPAGAGPQAGRDGFRFPPMTTGRLMVVIAFAAVLMSVNRTETSPAYYAWIAGSSVYVYWIAYVVEARIKNGPGRLG